MHGNLNMAFKVNFLLVLCLKAMQCTAEQTQCSEALCEVLPVKEDVASEFQLLASEKGVRMIYLNLKIGNDTYHPLELKDEFLPWRWVWAKSIRETMLSLPYDYDILSLGLLNYQVRSITVQLQDYPSGCLNRSSCQDEVIGRALLKNVTKGNFGGELQRKGEVVCVAFIDTGIHDFFDGNVVFHCCERDNRVPETIRCEQLIKRNSLLVAFTYVLNVLTIVLIFYCPALLLALPSCIFNLEEEIEKEKLQESGSQAPLAPDRSEYNSLDQSPVYLDDASPITCSTLLGKCGKYIKDLLDFSFAFNFKLAFLWYCAIPFFSYVKLGLTLLLKSQFLEETSNKNNASLVGTLFSVIFAFQTPTYFYFSIITLIVFPFVTIIFSSPEDFSFLDHPHHVGVSDKPDLSKFRHCYICNRFMPSVGLDMLRHMKILKAEVFESANRLMGSHRVVITLVQCCTKPFEKLIVKPCKRLRRAIVMTCLLVFPCVIFLLIIYGLVLGVICFCTFLVHTGLACLRYSPLVCLWYFFIRKVVQIVLLLAIDRMILDERDEETDEDNCAKWMFLILCLTLGFVMSTILIFFCLLLLVGCSLIASCIVSLSCRFVVKMIGFLIMGLVLNAEIVSPFVTFFVVVSTNMYLCYYNLQERYKEVKEMILSKHWKQLNRPGRDTGVDLSSGREDTIPESLFWHVCNEKSKSTHNVLPIRREICCMLGKMTLISIFLFLSLCSVIFLGNSYNIPAVASTIAVFVSGVIPGLFFKGLTNAKKFSGAKKKEMIDETELAVKEYLREMERTGTDRSAAPVNRQDIELTEYDMV